MRRRIAGAVLFVFLAAACGGDGDGGNDQVAGGRSTTTAPTSTSSTTPVDLATVVLTQADLPSGWTSVPSPRLALPAEKEFRECAGLPGGELPAVDSPHFSHKPASRVSVMAVPASPEQLDAWYSAVSSQVAIDCLEKRFDHELELTAVGQAVTPNRGERLVFPAAGDGLVAVRSVARFVEGDNPLYSDVIFVKKGQLELTFSFSDTPDPFPPDLAQRLVQTVVARA